MKLRDYTTTSGLLPHLECRDLTDAVTQLVHGLVAAGVVTEGDRLITEILRLEQNAGTSVGGGLVVPHARFSSVRRLQIAAATLTQPLNIPSIDDCPVDIVLLLVGPPHEPRQMLRLLARLARLVKNQAFLEGLRSAQTPAEMAAAFPEME
jgi:PTS system nitrogen regulatory IIA component